MIRISRENYNKMVEHARAELPNEACGLIGGMQEGEDKVVMEVYLLTNLDHSSEHFSLDPGEQLAAIKDMRAKGIRPLGNWHSHPETPSRPSREDKRLAYDSSASYMILSLMDREKPVLNSFHISKDQADREDLRISYGGDGADGNQENQN